jgi:ubiquinone/menaquinone biosynthesis C-methylase UbiE
MAVEEDAMKENKLDKAIPVPTAKKIYNFIGKSYDWFSSFDARAKERALELLDVQPGEHILEVGIGTGKLHTQIHSAVQPDGIAYGMDISEAMVRISHQRYARPVCQADARQTPFVKDIFDRIFMSYVLDLLPVSEIPGVLASLLRVLKPAGSVVIVALTEGVDRPSKALVAAWKAAYAVSPVVCAGCRPLQLTALVEKTGFSGVHREVVVQLAVPSEIIVAHK